MNTEQQRIAIAEACGWIKNKDSQGFTQTMSHPTLGVVETATDLPNYLTDLNAMHEAEKWLISKGGLPTYEHFLRYNEIKDDNEPWFGSIHATASQRAEAFLRTLNLWKDS